MNGDYSAMAQQAAGAYFGGGGAAAAAGGGGGNSSSLKASQDSTFGFNNNADFTVGSKQNNVPTYLIGGIAAIAILALILKK